MADPINNFLTGCPEDCDDVVTLPAIPEEQDCTSYDQELSQVSDLIIRPEGAPDVFASWATTPTYVADSIDNTVTDNSKSKHVVGIGGVAEPTNETLQYPKLREKDGEGTYILEMRFLQLTGGQYDFFRKMQCGWTGFTFYYAGLDNYVYGKSGGIQPSKVKVVFPKGAANTDRNAAIVRITWKADGDPERRVNPIA